jgi:uracil-DNA glycosylase family 4
MHRQDGLTLYDCYITQVLHCAPPDNKPALQEIEACRSYMLTELKLLPNLRVIVALGQIAFDAYLRTWQRLGMSLPAPKPRFRHGAQYQLSNRCTLIASYHPSQQNTFTGRLTRPMFHNIFALAQGILAT